MKALAPRVGGACTRTDVAHDVHSGRLESRQGSEEQTRRHGHHEGEASIDHETPNSSMPGTSTGTT